LKIQLFELIAHSTASNHMDSTVDITQLFSGRASASFGMEPEGSLYHSLAQASDGTTRQQAAVSESCDEISFQDVIPNVSIRDPAPNLLDSASAWGSSVRSPGAKTCV